MKKEYFVIIIVFILLWTAGLSVQGATIKEGTEIIKTYRFSDPDPVPIMARSAGMWGASSRLYPYFSFDKFSDTAIEKSWKVVRMENPYIKVSILPEVGGKIWGAIEKSTQKEFLYTNHVLKFREIALRGPWSSGGVELNFGVVGHAPSCAAPVDYLLRKNPDGSVSCVVGTMDLTSRSRWSVTITLPKDKAFFETNAFWYNPSALNQSYYCWMNAAVKVGDDLQYIYPGRGYVKYGSAVQKPWPIDEKGRDLSWYKNNNFGSSRDYFVVGEYENFYGGYWHNCEFGYGHWALYDDMPGKKLFFWALSPEGGIWEGLLTDNDGQYCEPQAGRLFSQYDHEFFTPYTADLWREIWFPYKKIGPMVKATPYGVLNVTRTGNSITLGLCPLQKLDEKLVVTADGKELYSEHLRLKPLEVYKKTLPLVVEKGKLQVSLGKKLSYSDEPKANDLNRPFSSRKPDENTAEGLYLAAERYEKSRDYHQALTKYLACLEKEPFHRRALSRVAELYCRRAEYEKALTYARKALENDVYDPDANYIYGVISRRLGNPVEAKEALGWAARSMNYRSGAYCQLAEIYLLEGNFDLAGEYSRRALDFNKYNLNAYQVAATTYRKIDQPKKAKKVLEQLLEIDPLNHLARFELLLLKPGRKNLSDFQSMIRNELPHENYLEMALYYVELGLDAEAVQLLKYASEHPTVYYWLGYLLKDEAPTESQTYLSKARRLSPRLVFPFREESIPVFRWAFETVPTDWKAKYYLGLIYWGKGRIQETRELFADCGEPDFAPFYIARSHLYKQVDSQKALADFEKALAVDDKSWKTWHHLIGFYNELGMFDKALTLSRKAVSTFPDEGVIRIDLMRTLVKNNRYEEPLAILKKTRALPYEGAREIHDMFVRCQLQLAFENIRKGDYASAVQYLDGSREYPEHLGTGRPYNPDFRMQDYLKALCYDKMGDRDKAEEVRKEIYDYTLRHWDSQRKNQYFGGLVLRYFGEQEKATQLLNKGKPSGEVLELIEAMDNRNN